MRKSTFHTGIETLDGALGDCLKPGKFIIAAGHTGCGKTILATQIALKNIEFAEKITYLSTEIDREHFSERWLSNDCNIPSKDIRELGTSDACCQKVVNEPDSIHYGKRVKAVSLLIDYSHEKLTWLDFKKINPADLGAHLLESKDADLVIYDWLQFPTNCTSHEVSESMRQQGEMLRNFSRDNEALVIATCQATTENPPAIHETDDCSTLHQCADAFVGMGWIDSPKLLDSDYKNQPAKKCNQPYHVWTRHSQETQKLTVYCEYGFQRIENERHDVPEDGPDHDSRAIKIRDESDHKGFVWFARNDYQKIASLCYANALNVFIYRLIRSSYESNTLGQSYDAVETLAKRLGLSHDKVRLANKKLCEIKVLETAGKKGKSIIWQVTRLAKTNELPNLKKLRIYRNLLDHKKEGLLNDSKGLFLWISLLFAANYDPNGDMGIVSISNTDIDDIASVSGLINREGLEAKLEELEADERLEIINNEPAKIKLKLTNFDVYQSNRIYPKNDS